MLASINRKLGLLLFIVAAVYLYLSFQLPNYEYAPIDADVIPKGLGILLLVLSVFLFFSRVVETDAEKAKRNIPKKNSESLPQCSP